MRRFAPALALAGLLGCEGDPRLSRAQRAITNGSLDAGDPGVVALLVGETVKCTGTLIAPRVVVTAAHCGIDRSTFRDFQVFVGAAVDGPGTRIALVDGQAHPDWDPTTGAHDIALAFLASPAATPWPLWDRPLDASLVGRELRIVGFGTTSSVATDAGQKRTGTAVVSAVDDARLTFAPAPSQTCLFDSGGPAFLTDGGVEYLVGVTGGGDGACAWYGFDLRIDREIAGFIQPYLDATAPGAARLGERCLYPEHCASGSCVTAADDPRITYCSQPCAAATECAAGMECSAGACLYPLPTPGALGSRCQANADCAGNACATDPESGASWCSEHCIPTGSSCGGGLACLAVEGAQFYCLPRPAPAGCAAMPAGRPSPSALALALACIAMHRRRRRH